MYTNRALLLYISSWGPAAALHSNFPKQYAAASAQLKKAATHTHASPLASSLTQMAVTTALHRAPTLATISHAKYSSVRAVMLPSIRLPSIAASHADTAFDGSCRPPGGDRLKELRPRHRHRIGYGVLVFELVAIVQCIQHPRQLPSLEMASLRAPAVEILESSHQFDGVHAAPFASMSFAYMYAAPPGLQFLRPPQGLPVHITTPGCGSAPPR